MSCKKCNRSFPLLLILANIYGIVWKSSAKRHQKASPFAEMEQVSMIGSFFFFYATHGNGCSDCYLHIFSTLSSHSWVCQQISFVFIQVVPKIISSAFLPIFDYLFFWWTHFPTKLKLCLISWLYIHCLWPPKSFFFFNLLNVIVCDDCCYNLAPLIEKLISSTSCIFFKRKISGVPRRSGGSKKGLITNDPHFKFIWWSHPPDHELGVPISSLQTPHEMRWLWSCEIKGH